MTNRFNTQVAALALAAVVTMATLGGMSAVANTEMATAQAETVVAQAAVQTVTVVGHRVHA